MEQFTKEEAQLIYNLNIEHNEANMISSLKPVYRSIRVKLIRILNDELDIPVMSPTPAAAFELMSEKKYKAKIDKLETELQGSKDYSRTLAVFGKLADIVENTDLRMENADLKSRFDNVSDGFKAVLEQLAEVKKELKYSNQTRDALNKSNKESVVILDDLISVFSNQRQLPQIQAAVDFINNKLF